MAYYAAENGINQNVTTTDFEMPEVEYKLIGIFRNRPEPKPKDLDPTRTETVESRPDPTRTETVLKKE
jgi:hypothetical protein